MNRLSYKYKIYILAAAGIVVALVFFTLIYPAMDRHNAVVAEAVAAKNREYQEVLAEQTSFQAGQRDLQTLQSKAIQPDELFSQDTKVVKEIKALETLAQELGLKFTLQVSGIAKSQPKLPKATAQLNAVPYGMVLEGPFEKVVAFMESAGHLGFVTQTKAINIAALPGSRVRASLTSEFYVKP